MKHSLIYQPKLFEPGYSHDVNGDPIYRVIWFGGESTQLHFQKRVLLPPPNDKKRTAWVDRDICTLVCMPTRVNDLYEKMRDHYDCNLHKERKRLEKLLQL